jgi:hypothetical protein
MAYADQYKSLGQGYNIGMDIASKLPALLGGKLRDQLSKQYQAGFSGLQNQQQSEANIGYDAIMNQAQKAYNPDSIANYYNIAQGNLNRAAGNIGAQTGRAAGAHATNMLNPSSFILGSISQSQAPYAAQSQQLQATGAQAQQQGAEGLTNLMYLLQRAKQGDAQAAQQLQYQYDALAQQQRLAQQQIEASQASPFSQFLAPVAGFLGSSTGTRLLFPNSYK